MTQERDRNMAFGVWHAHKNSRWAQKWYGHALSTRQVWWRERKNMGVCLFVCHAYGLCIFRL